MSSIYNHKFDPPVIVDGEEVAAVDVREPTVRDYLDANRAASGDQEREVHLIGITCGRGAAWVSKMPLSDFFALSEGASDFFSLRGRRRRAKLKG